MAFFSLRNTHTFFIIILGAIAIPVVVSYVYPQYLQDSGYIAIGIIMALVIALPIGANVEGRGYPHATQINFDTKTKTFYRAEDYFFDQEPRPSQPVLDVWPIWGKDKSGNDVGVKFGGRWWFPYLAKTRWGITFGEFHDALLHIYVLPHPWKKFLSPGRRESAAYLYGEEISHSNSTVLVCALAPFKRDFVGTALPVYVGVLSSYTMTRITENWEEAMNEWARLSQDVDKLLKEKADEIFPKQQLDELMPLVYPEIKVADKKRADMDKIRVVAD